MDPARGSTMVALPPALLAEVEAAAHDERRPVADVLREVVEDGLGHRRWKARAEKEGRRARNLGLPTSDQPLTAQDRQAFGEKISAGMNSARQGRLVDGEALFARIYAEMDELERSHGHE